MKKFFTKFIEGNKKLCFVEMVLFVLLMVSSIALYVTGIVKVNKNPGEITYKETIVMTRNLDFEDYDEEENTVFDVLYEKGDASIIVSYNLDEYNALDDDAQITAYQFEAEDGAMLYFVTMTPDQKTINQTAKAYYASEAEAVFSIATSLLILGISLGVILFFSKVFTTYEKCWFISIMVLATIVSIIFPEESANGVSGIWIMLLYLLDTFLNILCELLISKQSRWNFIVSVAVEITEIAICLVLMYRFATMVSTLFFWLPIDIISFINWSKHKDEEVEDLTKVRRLKGWQEVLILVGIGIWTLGIGYLLSGLDISSDIFGGNEVLENIICYMDACVSAVAICNGVFILFRLREQWIAWFVDAILEALINILCGQYVLLVLKLGYITNSTYGYIKWTKYIKTHKEEERALF